MTDDDVHNDDINDDILVNDVIFCYNNEDNTDERKAKIKYLVCMTQN